MSKLLIILCGVMICTIFVPHDAFAKNFAIKLSESMTLDSGDTKPGNKKNDTKKEPKKKESKKKEIKKPKSKKTKHNTAKNSVNNVR